MRRAVGRLRADQREVVVAQSAARDDANRPRMIPDYAARVDLAVPGGHLRFGPDRAESHRGYRANENLHGRFGKGVARFNPHPPVVVFVF